MNIEIIEATTARAKVRVSTVLGAFIVSVFQEEGGSIRTNVEYPHSRLGEGVTDMLPYVVHVATAAAIPAMGAIEQEIHDMLEARGDLPQEDDE